MSAYHNYMTRDEYIYIATTYIAEDDFKTPWITGDRKEDELAHAVYQSLFQVIMVIPFTTHADTPK